MKWILLAALTFGSGPAEVKMLVGGSFPTQAACEQALEMLKERNDELVGTCEEVPNER